MQARFTASDTADAALDWPTNATAATARASKDDFTRLLDEILEVWVMAVSIRLCVQEPYATATRDVVPKGTPGRKIGHDPIPLHSPATGHTAIKNPQE
jgi:hypothetical protein